MNLYFQLHNPLCLHMCFLILNPMTRLHSKNNKKGYAMRIRIFTNTGLGININTNEKPRTELELYNLLLSWWEWLYGEITPDMHNLYQESRERRSQIEQATKIWYEILQ